jgi:predicted short-subunit dehydrogenase-like oxidoreductase (DUF2520 family)
MRVAIVGAGRVGRTLGRLARRAGFEIGPVVCRTGGSARAAATFIGAGRPGTAPEGAELTLVAVPDGEIAGVARALRAPAGAVVAHTCAGRGAELLRPHRPAGALHPLRSFGDPALAAELFRGTACAVDGDPEAVKRLRAFVKAIGGVPLRVRSDRKALYHAGAVFASNYLVAALEAALRLFEEAGVRRAAALPALRALAEGTLANVAAVGIPESLTGPVERGDTETVRRHAEALRARAPELADAYATLARLAIEVALEKGSIARAAAGALNAALGSLGAGSVRLPKKRETARR